MKYFVVDLGDDVYPFDSEEELRTFIKDSYGPGKFVPNIRDGQTGMDSFWIIKGEDVTDDYCRSR